MGIDIRYDRIKKGDKILVTILAEPLQEMFDNLHEMGYEIKDMIEEVKENGGPQNSPPELVKKLSIMKHTAMIKREETWQKVEETYNIWGRDLSIRRGYCIVEPCKEEMDEIKKAFKKLFDEIGGDFQ